jgi:hypothetical protein
MHADLARIATLPRYVRQPRFIDPPRHLSLAHDFRRIQDVARQIPDLGLIVLDPLTAYLDGVRAYSQAEVRTLLWHLSLLAQESGLAVLAVTHFRKDAAASVLHRTLGSLAFTTAVRVVLALFKDPAVAGRRLLLPAKMNVIPDAAGRAFTIEDSRLVWEPDPVPLTAQDLSDLTAHSRARAERLAEAARWLRDVLADGPLTAAEVHARARAADKRFTSKVLYAARHPARIELLHDGHHNRWLWQLAPNPNPQ